MFLHQDRRLVLSRFEKAGGNGEFFRFRVFRFYDNLPRLERRDERHVVREDRHDTARARNGNRLCLAGKKYLINF